VFTGPRLARTLAMPLAKPLLHRLAVSLTVGLWR
jgi:hypothetical protein